MRHTGWTRDTYGGYWKCINGIVWSIRALHDGWVVSVSDLGPVLAKRSTLNEAKALAHATAKLWEGRNDG